MGGQILLVENMAVGNHCRTLVTRCRNLGLNASHDGIPHVCNIMYVTCRLKLKNRCCKAPEVETNKLVSQAQLFWILEQHVSEPLVSMHAEHSHGVRVKPLYL